MDRETVAASTAPLPILQAAAAVAANGTGTTATAAATTTTALAPGFRFHPTDEELVGYYLKRKVSKKPVRCNAICDVDIYKYEPWDLADLSSLKTRDREWYFFTLLDKKFGFGERLNRSTGRGYWKATGKDREVHHDSQVIGMKKTLVFYSGRNPNGVLTHWVMHEYRLVEAELEKCGASQVAHVLCKIFHKNNKGPPSGNRYAPFIEEEWDDGGTAVFQGVDAVDEVAAGDIAYNEGNNVEQLQDTQSICKDPLSVNNEPPRETQNLLAVNNEPPRETLNLLPMCKSEIVEDVTPIGVLNTQAPFPLPQSKRKRHNDSGSSSSNALENSTRTTQDLFSSTKMTAATTKTTAASTSMASATTMPISTSLELSLMASLEPKESPRVCQPTFDTANLDSSVPPSVVEFINDLQKELHEISVETELLKLETMSAHTMINILRSRTDFLNNENKDLKKSIRDRDAK